MQDSGRVEQSIPIMENVEGNDSEIVITGARQRPWLSFQEEGPSLLMVMWQWADCSFRAHVPYEQAASFAKGILKLLDPIKRQRQRQVNELDAQIMILTQQRDDLLSGKERQ